MDLLTILSDLLKEALKGSSGGIAPLLLIYIGWSTWDRNQEKKIAQKTQADLNQALSQMQAALAAKSGEERDSLIKIIDRYHEGQISIREAVSEMKAVLQVLSQQRGGGGGH